MVVMKFKCEQAFSKWVYVEKIDLAYTVSDPFLSSSHLESLLTDYT